MPEPSSGSAYDLKPYGLLRFDSRAPIAMRDLRQLVASLDDAYSYYSFYAVRVDLAVHLANNLGERGILSRALELRLHDEKHLPGDEESIQGLGLMRRWGPGFPRAIGDGAAHPLVLYSVSLSSPGFWEFLGSLNPLGQLRGYLSERHERKKEVELRSFEKEMKAAEVRLKNAEAASAEIAAVENLYDAASRTVGVDDARSLAARAFAQLGVAIDTTGGGMDPKASVEPRQLPPPAPAA